MHQIGLLLLTCPTRWVLDHLGGYLKFASSMVCNRLYIKHEPYLSNRRLQTWRDHDVRTLYRVIPAFYFKASEVCKNIDVRVLQASCKSTSYRDRHIKLNFDVVLTDSSEDEGNIIHYLKEEFNKTCSHIVKLKPAHKDVSLQENLGASDEFPKIYKTLVLGGTFDHLHSGHKVLLSEAILRTSEKLIVGVTDGLMLQNKVLWELIEPIQHRIEKLEDFLIDIDPTVDYNVVPIYDGYGPSVEVPEIDCIVVSEETKKGGDKVNQERLRRGFKELDMYIIPLVENSQENILDEPKVSSSLKRMDLLGTLLNQPEPKPDLPSKPYVIGLYGGISDSCALIESILQSHEVPVINCDDLFHSICDKDSTEFKQVVQEFGDEICDADGNISYCALERKTYQDKHRREWISSLLQNKLLSAVKKHIHLLQENGVPVVALKVPTIIDVCCKNMVHEVWAAIISKSKGVQNIKSKYFVSDEEALALISSETSHLVSQANVVLSTSWDSDFSRKQVEKALQRVHRFLKGKEEVMSQV